MNMSEISEQDADKLQALKGTIQKILPELDDDKFNKIVEAWGDDKRVFHQLNHLLDETKPENYESADNFARDNDLENGSSLKLTASQLALVAALFHDIAYPTLLEESPYQEVINKHIDEDGKLQPVQSPEDDKIHKIVTGIFGIEDGTEPPPSGGKNEIYSAIIAADTLQAMGREPKETAAIVAIIDATIPFQMQEKFQEVSERLEKVNNDLNLGLNEQDIAQTMVAIVAVANSDIAGFLGGADTLGKVQPEHVIASDNGANDIMLESNPKLRTEDYNIRELAEENAKVSGLYANVIPIKEKDGVTEVPNLFHEAKIGDKTFPEPPNDAKTLNQLAAEVIEPVKLARDCKLIASTTLLAIAEEKKWKDKNVRELLDAVEPNSTAIELSDPSKSQELAMAILSNPEACDHDKGILKLAQTILRDMDEKHISTLAQEAREALKSGSSQEIKEVLDEVKGKLGEEVIQKLENEMQKCNMLAEAKAVMAGVNFSYAPQQQTPEPVNAQEQVQAPVIEYVVAAEWEDSPEDRADQWVTKTLQKPQRSSSQYR
jgi:hypothetical protein